MTAGSEHISNRAYGPVPRKEDARFVRGKGTFVDDVALPGMLYGAVLRSPLAHARILSIDTAAARGAPERRGRDHGRDARRARSSPGCPPCPPTCRPCWRPTRSGSRARRSRSWWRRDRYSARDALELINVEYEPLPAVVDARRALDPAAELIRDDLPGKEGQPDLRLVSRRPGGHRRGLRVRRRRHRAGHALPEGAPRAAGDLRRGRRHGPGQRPADDLVHHPGPARAPHAVLAGHRAARAQDPGRSRPISAAASATRCRSIPATCAPSSARSSPASRSSGWKIGQRT